MRTRTLLGIGAVAAGIIAVAAFTSGGGPEAARYRLAPVQTGGLIVAVAATGSIEAVGTVLIGSQLSGQVAELLVDYNSEVRRGDIIARLDPETYAARLRQAEAELAIAQAGLATADATVVRAQSDLEIAQADLQRLGAQADSVSARLTESERALVRTQKLFDSRVVARANLETAEANHDQSAADLAAARAAERAQEALIGAREAALRIAEADVQTALAQVQQREAQRDQARIDLDRTIIRAPVDGVVVQRSIDVGQTVAASLQAPELFTIAEDLREMQVKVSVDEADIGRVRAGMDTTFTVDAYPRRDFSGAVKQIRLAPQEEQNVVTYDVIVTAENADLALLPGMTANVQLIVDERAETRRIPNAALRFRPEGATERPAGTAVAAPAGAAGARRPGAQLLERLRETVTLTPEQETRIQELMAENRQRARALGEGGTGREAIRAELSARADQVLETVLTPEQRTAFQAARADRGATRDATVYVLGPGNEPEAVPVTVGISDGQFTELVAGAIEAGQELVVGIDTSERQTRRLPRLGF